MFGNVNTVVVVTFSALILGIFLTKCYRRRRRRLVDLIIHAHQPSLDDTYRVRNWDELRWIMQLGPHLFAAQQGLPSSQPTTTDELCRRRQAFVHDTLVCKKVIIEKPLCPSTNQAKTTEDEEEKTLKPKIRRLKSDLVLPQTESSDGSDDDNGDFSEMNRPICVICLKEYQVDEEICWSNNQECNHMFHRECMEEWLLRHNECPCCRKNYVEPSLSPQNDDDMENHHHRVVPPLVDSRHGNFSLSQDPDFFAAIESMYRQAQARLLYRNSIENNSHSEDDRSSSSSTTTTSSSSPVGELEVAMGFTDDEATGTSSTDPPGTTLLFQNNDSTEEETTSSSHQRTITSVAENVEEA